MNRTMTRIMSIASAAALLAIGFAGGGWWARRYAGGITMSPPAAATPQGGQALYWYDPMMPEQHFDKPGKSPFMDMQLVPKYADDIEDAGIRIAAGVQQNVGIRTAMVDVGRLAAGIRVPATVTWDLRLESMVSARVDAIVSHLNVKAPYQRVRRGQPLATVLAPAWGVAMAEARALGQAQSESARSLQSAARQRLRVLGLPRNAASAGGSAVLTAPGDGVVSEILVREGQTILTGMPMFRINGTETVWLEAAIPQAATVGIGPGTPVEASFSALPGRRFSGEVETLLPLIDTATRSRRARIVLRNPDGVLVPGMFAELLLQPEAGTAAPSVPTEALIATGSDTRVIVVGEDGRFQPVRVRTGRVGGGRTEILAGLTGGERVVTSGQFLIDSEASLSGALQRLDAPATTLPQPPHTPAEPMPQPQPQPQPAPATTTTTPTKIASSRQRKVLYWYDPMMPDEHFDKPGKSPFMDMQLVPKYADESAAAKGDRP